MTKETEESGNVYYFRSVYYCFMFKLKYSVATENSGYLLRESHQVVQTSGCSESGLAFDGLRPHNSTVCYLTRIQRPIILEVLSTANRLCLRLCKALAWPIPPSAQTDRPTKAHAINWTAIQSVAWLTSCETLSFHDSSQPTGRTNESLAVVGIYLLMATTSGDESFNAVDTFCCHQVWKLF